MNLPVPKFTKLSIDEYDYGKRTVVGVRTAVRSFGVSYSTPLIPEYRVISKNHAVREVLHRLYRFMGAI